MIRGRSEPAQIVEIAMPKRETSMSNLTLWDDRDLYEAYLLIPTMDALSQSDQGILDEMHRRACGGARSHISQERTRLMGFRRHPA